MFTSGTFLQLCLLASCSQLCTALFYTNSRENDYPRIGKRLELYKVLKGGNSLPNYSKTNTQGQDKSETLHDFGNSDIYWDIPANKPAIFREPGQDRNLGKVQPILIAVQERLPENIRQQTKTQDIDEFLELFQRMNPELDKIL